MVPKDAGADQVEQIAAARAIGEHIDLHGFDRFSSAGLALVVMS